MNAWCAGMLSGLHTRSGTVKSAGQHSILTVSPHGPPSHLRVRTNRPYVFIDIAGYEKVPEAEQTFLSGSTRQIRTTTEQDGDVQDARTLKYLFQRNIFASVEKSTVLTITVISLLILVENFADAPENALILVTCMSLARSCAVEL